MRKILDNLITDIPTIFCVKSHRGRAWRRFQQRKYRHKNLCQTQHSRSYFCGEKNWSLMYGRKEKIYRAKKLGFVYPIGRDEIYHYGV